MQAHKTTRTYSEADAPGQAHKKNYLSPSAEVSKNPTQRKPPQIARNTARHRPNPPLTQERRAEKEHFGF
jgi:hypothetical protein